MVCSVVVSVAWEVGNLLIPVYCASVKLSPSDIGWVLGSFSAASFAVRLLMPYLMRHMREWIMIALTLLISAIAFVLFPFFESQLPLMACAFLLGLGLGASLPNMMSLVYRLAPKGRTGEAIGLRLMLINSSKATFPVAMGALGAVIGAGASLWGLAIFVFLGFLLRCDRLRRLSVRWQAVTRNTDRYLADEKRSVGTWLSVFFAECGLQEVVWSFSKIRFRIGNAAGIGNRRKIVNQHDD